jgi:hypothetical protein
MKTIKFFNKLPLLALAASISLTSCKKDEDGTDYPDAEHDHEVITDVILHFEDSEGHVIEAHAQDEDGEGAGEMVILKNIELEANTTYDLSFEILNKSEHDHGADEDDDHGADEDDHGHNDKISSVKMDEDDHVNDDDHEGKDIGKEILEEGDEHQIFFAFTNDAFSNPLGDGNIDNASDPLVYDDEDVNGKPIGLKTKWTTGDETVTNGEFRVRLMHQVLPLKTDSSDSETGDKDFDITFKLNITE